MKPMKKRLILHPFSMGVMILISPCFQTSSLIFFPCLSTDRHFAFMWTRPFSAADTSAKTDRQPQIRRDIIKIPWDPLSLKICASVLHQKIVKADGISLAGAVALNSNKYGP
jgi:hypothetical protein